MTRARNSANLASQGNLFVDITNDRTGIGSVAPAQNLHVAGTAGFHGDTTFVGDSYNVTWDRSENRLKFDEFSGIRLGNNNELQIDHRGTSYILNIDSMPLQIGSNSLQLMNAGTTQTYLNASVNSDLLLYRAGSERFRTKDYGVQITGTTDTDGLVVSGVATVTTMNVTGVLTYDDVTSVDSVGIVTARQGVSITGGNLTISTASPQISLTETNGDPDYRIFVNGGIFNIEDVTNNIGKFSITSSRITLNDTVLVNDSILYIHDKIVHWADDNTTIRFPTNDTISFETAGSERVRITSTGRFGIGTQSPSKTLHVHGDSGSELPVYWIRGGSSVGGYLYSDGGGSGIVGGDGVLANTGIYLVTDTRIDFRVNGAERARIDSSGRLLIGRTTGNSANLLVQSGAQVFAGANNGNSSCLTMDYNTATGSGRIMGHASSGGSLEFLTNASGAGVTPKLRITSTGTVLHGSGAIATQKASNGGFDISCNTHSLVIGADSNSGALSQARTNNANKDGRIGHVHYTNAEEPIGLFRVSSTSSENNVFIGGGSSLFNAATTLQFYTAANNTTTNGSERLRITPDGKIGINQTSPTCQLQIDSGSSGAGTVTHLELNHKGNETNDAVKLNFARAGSDIGSIVLEKVASNNTTDFIFNTRSFNTVSESMRITGAGKVGINTDNPSQELTVYGTDPIISVQEATASSQVDIGTGTVTGFINIQKADGTRTIQLNGAGDCFFATGNKVGINVTSPQALLDVGGNVDGNVQASFTRANDPNFRIQVRNESSSNNVGASQGKFGLFYASNSADICGMQFHRGSSTGAGTLSFTTGGTERLSIDSSGKTQFSSATDNIIHTSSNSSRLRLFGGSNESVSNGAVLTLHGVSHSNGNYADLAAASGGHIQFRIGTSEKLRITNGGLDPSTDAVTDIGNSSKRFRHLNLSGKINNLFETIDRGIQVENSSANSEIRVKGTGGNRADMMILQTGTANANLWLDASNGDLSGADYANIKHTNSTLDLEFINYAADITMYVRGGSLGAGGLRKAFHAHENGATELYFNGNKRFETLTDGVKVSGTTDGVLNLTTTDGRGSFIRFQQSGNSKVWVGSSEGFGQGDQDDGALMAIDNIHIMSGQTRRITVNGSGMAEIYGGQNGYPWGASFRNSGESGGYNSVRCFFEGTNGQSNRTYSIMSENGKFRISGGGTAGSSTGSQLVYLSGTSSTSWSSGSDIRLKENITEIPNVLDKVKNYRCARFNFIGDDASDMQNIKFGFIAQDWVDDFPEVLTTSTQDADDPTDTTEYYGMQYTETIPVLLKAIQELNAKVETLQNEVNTLKSS